MTTTTSYTVLKPLCDAVYSRPSADTIGALRSAIDSIAPELLQLMQDYVLLPLVNRIDATDDAQMYARWPLCTQLNTTRSAPQTLNPDSVSIPVAVPTSKRCCWKQ